MDNNRVRVDTQPVIFDSYTEDTIKSHFNTLKNNVMWFWGEHFKPLSNFIYGVSFPQRHEYARYFCDPTVAMALINQQDSQNQTLNIQTFEAFFTHGPGYWFYFKNITMAKIERDCKLFVECNHPPLVKDV